VSYRSKADTASEYEHRSRRRRSSHADGDQGEEPGYEPPKPELDEFEMRTAFEEVLKTMQLVPDHLVPVTVNEAIQNYKMNKQQKHNFPPIVRTTIEKHMPPEEIRKYYQQDDLLTNQQFTKIKGYLLNTTALATTALSSLHITSVGTKYLHDAMKEFVNDPDNRTMFDECGQYIRNTIFDSPVFSIGSSIMGVVRESCYY
jgi:hypothetical protein